jgi:hypothetical protein
MYHLICVRCIGIEPELIGRGQDRSMGIDTSNLCESGISEIVVAVSQR